jgi:heptosyltransferase-2
VDKIAVIQTAFPGDVILATPVFEALKNRNSDCRLTAVVRPESYPLISNNPFVDEKITFDKNGKDCGLRGLLKISRLIRDLDWAIIIQRYFRSALLAYLAGAKKRTGFDISGFRFLYNDVVPYDRKKHEVHRCLDLAGESDHEKYRPRIFINDESRATADMLLSDRKVKIDFAVAAPGSVWATKRYAHYLQLIDLIKEILHLDIVLLGGEGDIELAGHIENSSGHKPINLVGKTDLLVSAEIISRARIVFANDSAPAHMAAAVDTPVVAIFGPTVPEFGFAPYSRRSRVVDIGELYCRPCSTHGTRTCPQKHFRCMKELPAGNIIEAAKSLLF